jgi:hypothetical protein
MWTRLVAGAAAHDINNLAQGLFNLLSLAASPEAPAESLTRYAALAREGIKELQDLGRDLRTLADVEPDLEVQRLDLACADAMAHVPLTLGRSLELGPCAEDVLVAGSGAALRLSIKAVLGYALAASTSGASVSLGTLLEDHTAVVVIDAHTAPPPRESAEGELSSLMGGRERAFASAAGLVLAGAAVSLCGGEVRAGPSPEGGLRFKL